MDSESKGSENAESSHTQGKGCWDGETAVACKKMMESEWL